MKLIKRIFTGNKKELDVSGVIIKDTGLPYSTKLFMTGVNIGDVFIIQSLDYHVDVQTGLATLIISYYPKQNNEIKEIKKAKKCIGK